MELHETDIQTLLTWLSPAYLMPTAKRLGAAEALRYFPNPIGLLTEITETGPEFLAVYGAENAYKLARQQIRSYLTYVRKRDNLRTADLPFFQALRGAGYVSNFQALRPLQESTWRRTTFAIWDKEHPTINEMMTLSTEGVSQKDFNAIAIKALSDTLIEYPDGNRAILQKRVWKRFSGHLMLTVQLPNEEVGSIIVNPSVLDDLSEIKEDIWQRTKKLIKVYRSPYGSIFNQLLADWATCGMIASPAGALVACVGGSGRIQAGQSALLSHVNGIPLAMTVSQIIDQKANIYFTVDHRAFDASHTSKLYATFYSRVKDLLGR